MWYRMLAAIVSVFNHLDLRAVDTRFHIMLSCVLQRPPFLPPPMGNLPPPPGMIFPPGMPPIPASGTPSVNPAEEIWVENKTSEGKVSRGSARIYCSA